jgi:hypothetical protein
MKSVFIIAIFLTASALADDMEPNFGCAEGFGCQSFNSGPQATETTIPGIESCDLGLKDIGINEKTAAAAKTQIKQPSQPTKMIDEQ